MNSKNSPDIWHQFITDESLSSVQQEQFQNYMDLIIAWNKKFNLTGITKPPAIITDHFQDSLALGKAVDLQPISMIADIGTGAGLPGIPLKIKYPQLALLLIEVNQKKVTFLQEVIAQLGLKNIEVSSLDWRTFLRNTDYPVQIFCARASLQPQELIRIFKPSSPYQNSTVVYWASEPWKANEKIKQYITDTYPYLINTKKRKLVFFSNPHSRTP